MESSKRFGDVMVESRVASARGGGSGTDDVSLELRRGDSGIDWTWSSKHTLRRSRTGESAKETLLVAVGGAIGGLVPLYGGGDLYGGALIDGLIVFE